jgi:hypothetical protein
MQVANPLHLYYLHWRLQHCAVPKADLLTEEAMSLAKDYMPSARLIFHYSSAGHSALRRHPHMA